MDAPRFPLSAGTKTPSLTLVLPAFNEEDTISQSIREADEALAGLTSDYEILVVDDGCTDNTASIVEHEALSRPSVRLLRQPKNLGYGAALARGFREATKDLVSFSDSDCQFDLKELDRLMFLSRDYDIVCGYRIDRQDPWIRKLYSRVYNTIVRTLLGTRVRDVDCAMKVFHRDVIQGIPIETRGFFVNSEVLTKARLQNHDVVEVGVTHRPRAAGESTVSALHTIPVMGSILKFWWNTILFPQAALSATNDSSATSSSDSSTRWSVSHSMVAFLVLLVVCCGMLASNLSYPLIEPDESRYVQVAMEMVETGDWVTPKLNGVAYLDKPPLLYWMTATSMSVLGVNETASRLPTVFAAMLTVLMCFLVGQRLVGSRAAWCGSISLLLCGGFVLAGRFVVMDALLTCCTTICFLAGYLAIANDRVNWRWWLLASVACGFGVLTKGPVALVLCVPPLFAIQWISSDKRALRLSHWAALGALTVLMSAPWFVAVSNANPDFVSHFFLKHNLSRFASGFNHVQPFWFYIPVVFAGMFPASMLLPTLAVFLLGRSEAYRQHRTKDLGFLVVAAVWVVGFFSLSSSKLPTYILPALPLLSLLLGSMFEHCVIRPVMANDITSYLTAFPRRASAIAISMGLVAAVVNWQLLESSTLLPIAAFAVFVVAGLVLARFWKRDITSSVTGWGYTAAVSSAVVLFVFSSLVPAISNARSILKQAATAHNQDASRPVIYFGRESYGAEMRLPKESIVQISSEDTIALATYIEQHPQSIVVTSNGTIEAALKAISATTQLVSTGGRNHVHLTQPIPADSDRVAKKPGTVAENLDR